MQTRKRVVSPGVGPNGRLFVTIEVERKDAKTRLSITAVEGPRSNGDAIGSCGQCVEALDRLTSLSPGWEPETVARLKAEWERWHLNDMRAGCEHQRAAGWKSCPGHYVARDKRVRFVDETDGSGLVRLERTRVEIVNCAGVAETRIEDWLAGSEFYRGAFHCSLDMLSKACPECGYRYGSAWLYEEVPADVLAWLAGLPEGDGELPSAWR